jgi:hypothetical protein
MKLVKESLEEINPSFKNTIFETEYGNIDYIYVLNDKYPDGLLILNGSIVYREYRGTGKFKEMLRMLLSKFPEGTTIQGAVITKKLTSMFERIGFKKVDKIEYWGQVANCTFIQGILTKEMIDLI